MSDEPQLPPDACVALDTPCIGCGYNLKTLPVSRHCPECGMSIDQTLRTPRGRWVARLLGFTATMMVSNALVYGLGLYCLYSRPSYHGPAQISLVCVAPMLSVLVLSLLALLTGRLFLKYRTFLPVAAPLFAVLFLLWPFVLSSSSRFTATPTDVVVIIAMLVGPAWLSDVVRSVLSNMNFPDRRIRRRVRVAQGVSWVMLLLGMLSLYSALDFSYPRLLFLLIKYWEDWQIGTALGFMNVALGYCVGRTAQHVAGRLKRFVLPPFRVS